MIYSLYVLAYNLEKEKKTKKKQARRALIVMETRHMFLAALDAPCLSPKQTLNLEVNQAAGRQAGKAGRQARLKFCCNVQLVAV